MLPANELSRLRDEIEGYTLIDTCAILSGTAASDGQGGVSYTWGTVTASARCRLDQQRGREQGTDGKYQWFTTNVLSLPHDQTIAVGYRVVFSGTTYTVTSVNEGSGLAVKRATVERA